MDAEILRDLRKEQEHQHPSSHLIVQQPLRQSRSPNSTQAWLVAWRDVSEHTVFLVRKVAAEGRPG
ncbi:hypothetical protein ACFYQ5_20115 [Streptomyces sp. NPDC005794]|uniref:hypothetical protein n=1 Tax=Streptomyces sp. NPDC005794 TaxID=3364733 RepID=UPI0036BB0193